MCCMSPCLSVAVHNDLFTVNMLAEAFKGCHSSTAILLSHVCLTRDLPAEHHTGVFVCAIKPCLTNWGCPIGGKKKFLQNHLHI